MKKLFLLIIKFIPVIQMAGMLFNNILCYNDINININFILDYIFGHSVINTILLIVCSYVFHFCTWHRLIITANFINGTIAAIDCYHRLPLTDLQLLITYHIIATIFIIISTLNHIYNGKKNKNP